MVAIAVVVATAGGVIDPVGWQDPAQSRAFFPALILAGIALCGIAIAAGASTSAVDPDASVRAGRTVFMGLVVAVYAVALPLVGFVGATVGLCILVPLMLGYRNWLLVIGFAIAVVGLCWFIFIHLMNVPLDP